MLPPSPQFNAQASLSRAPPPPPPFSGGRELPALSSTARPGSSMSISSMLGEGPSRPPREPSTVRDANSTSITTSHPSPIQKSTSSASPTKLSQSNSFIYRKSPERQSATQAPTNRAFRAYSGGVPQRSYATVKAGSPDGHRYGPSSGPSGPQYSPISDTGSQQDWRQQHSKQSSVGRVTDRPNSQPNGYSNSPRDIERKRAEVEALRSDLAKQDEEASRDKKLRQENRNRSTSFEFLTREGQLARQGRLEPDTSPVVHHSLRDERVSGMNYPFLAQSVFSEPSVDTPRPNKDQIASRIFDRGLSQSSGTKGPLTEDSLRRLREERQGLSQQSQQSQQNHNYFPSASRPRFIENVNERQIQSFPQRTLSGSTAPDNMNSVDRVIQQSRGTEDSGQNHRSMLALMIDNNKRAGRISPLPQAVQGAQGRTSGPSSDPNIKNEFSRMFAGIGSGVGSASGASTPFLPSPKQNNETEPRISLAGRSDLIELAKSRNGSIPRKRIRKAKDDEHQDLEVIESRATAGPKGTRGIKRSRHSGHRHHSHQHVHQ